MNGTSGLIPVVCADLFNRVEEVLDRDSTNGKWSIGLGSVALIFGVLYAGLSCLGPDRVSENSSKSERVTSGLFYAAIGIAAVVQGNKLKDVGDDRQLLQDCIDAVTI